MENNQIEKGDALNIQEEQGEIEKQIQTQSNRQKLENKEPQNDENEVNLEIKIKTLDNSVYELKTKSTMLIGELKQVLEKHLQIPSSQQRLIFHGRLLNNNQTISGCRIEEGNVVHLVANAINNQESNTQISSPVEDQVLPTSPSSDVNQHGLIDGIIRNLAQSSVNRANLRRRNLQRRTMGHRIEVSQSYEVMRQNLTTVQQLLSAFSNLGEIVNQEQPQVFNFQNRKLYVGQWVDVKDTIDQWLEAQVIEVKDNQVFIHYNGWGSRWDEWIEMNSPRIYPFRTYTVQSVNSPFMSPNPINTTEIQHLDHHSSDLNELLYEVGLNLNKVCGMIFQIADIKQDREQREDKSSLKGQEEQALEMHNLIEESQRIDNKIIKNINEDAISLKSLKSLKSEKMKLNLEDDSSSIKSMKSDISKFTNPLNILHSNIGMKNQIMQEDSREEEKYQNQSNANYTSKSNYFNNNNERYLLSSQLAPIADRLGRLLVDLAPHIAMLGTQNQHAPNPTPANSNNFQNLSNLSILTNEGSQTSNNINNQVNNSNLNPNNVSNNNINNNQSYYFQIPVMLTASELLSVTPLRNNLDNIDIHIHATIFNGGAGLNTEHPTNINVSQTSNNSVNGIQIPIINSGINIPVSNLSGNIQNIPIYTNINNNLNNSQIITNPTTSNTNHSQIQSNTQSNNSILSPIYNYQQNLNNRISSTDNLNSYEQSNTRDNEIKLTDGKQKTVNFKSSQEINFQQDSSPNNSICSQNELNYNNAKKQINQFRRFQSPKSSPREKRVTFQDFDSEAQEYDDITNLGKLNQIKKKSDKLDQQLEIIEDQQDCKANEKKDI